MLRFIFVCVGVVVLSVAAIGAQYMMDGVSGAAEGVMARNNAQTTEGVQAVAMEETMSAEDLNAIETTAGTPEIDPNDSFTGGFTDKAPKALAEPAPVAKEVAPEAVQEQAN